MLLTFDDGPSEWTGEILDLLAEHGVSATFFVIGENVIHHPDVVLRAAREGHRIGNHTMNHPQLPHLVDDQVQRELAGCSALIEGLVGERPTLFRAPFLEHDARVDAIAAAESLIHFGADVKPDDFAMEDAEAIARWVLDEAGADSVVCLHDGVPPDGGTARCLPSRAPTVEAVRLILGVQVPA